jgi:predicted ATPase
LTEGLLREGQSEEAFGLMEDAVTKAACGSGTFELPDLLRTSAKTHLALSPPHWTAAEKSLKTSIDLARKQSSLGWELRSAILLFRLWTDQGRADAALDMLANIYGRYTEGFGTADLRAARALLSTSASDQVPLIGPAAEQAKLTRSSCRVRRKWKSETRGRESRRRRCGDPGCLAPDER